jgi:plasmid stabilization system protein ParE
LRPAYATLTQGVSLVSKKFGPDSVCPRQLADFPMSGRMVPEYELKEIREVVERPYRIIYRLWPDRVEILAVIHSAQRMPSEP